MIDLETGCCIYATLLMLIWIIQFFQNGSKKTKWKYEVGDEVIIYNNGRYFGCKVLEKRYYTKGKVKNKPCYKLKIFSKCIDIMIVNEGEILCTSNEYGRFPRYDKQRDTLGTEYGQSTEKICKINDIIIVWKIRKKKK